MYGPPITTSPNSPSIPPHSSIKSCIGVPTGTSNNTLGLLPVFNFPIIVISLSITGFLSSTALVILAKVSPLITTHFASNGS